VETTILNFSPRAITSILIITFRIEFTEKSSLGIIIHVQEKFRVQSTIAASMEITRGLPALDDHLLIRFHHNAGLSYGTPIAVQMVEPCAYFSLGLSDHLCLMSISTSMKLAPNMLTSIDNSYSLSNILCYGEVRLYVYFSIGEYAHSSGLLYCLQVSLSLYALLSPIVPVRHSNKEHGCMNNFANTNVVMHYKESLAVWNHIRIP
jgi:hypothetical protein